MVNFTAFSSKKLKVKKETQDFIHDLSFYYTRTSFFVPEHQPSIHSTWDIYLCLEYQTLKNGPVLFPRSFQIHYDFGFWPEKNKKQTKSVKNLIGRKKIQKIGIHYILFS